MTPRSARTKLALSVCVLALALSGCGGGATGGGGGVNPITPTPAPPPPPPPPPPAPPPPPPPPPGVNYNDAEYQRSNGANFHNAISAYNAGATGQGVKIALVDTGVNAALPDFAGKIDPASQDVVANRGITDTEGHGTATAAVAAAARNGSGILGVAFDATIISLNTSDPNNCTDKDGCKHSDSDIARAVDLARQGGARVINISLGGDTSSAIVNSAIARAAAAGIIVVMSAGNSGDTATGDNPEGFALGAAQHNANVIIAGAVDQNRNIASFSNRAGTGASFYLAALGDKVVAPDQTGKLFLWTGTSFSAPIVSGAAALLASAFPNLTGQQIISILEQSADDAGAPGVDPIFGHGILNITRAMQPIGTLSLPDSKVAFNPVPEGGTSSGPMGDASPMVKGVIVLDGFSRAYALNLAQTLRQAPREQPLAQGLQQGLGTMGVAHGGTALSITVSRDLVGQPQVGFAQLGLTYQDARRVKVLSGLAVSRLSRHTKVAFGISESGRTLQQRLVAAADHAFLVARDPMTRMGFYANAGSSLGVRQSVGRIGVTLTSERGHVYEPWADQRFVQPRYRIDALTLDRRVGHALVTLGATRLTEEQTVLGARFTGPAGAGGATSWFVDAGARYDLGGGWGLDGNYRRGWTEMPGAGGLSQGGRLATDAWSFDIAREGAFRPDDSLALRIMQPLRVRSGGLDLRVPVSYDYSTLTAGYENELFNLAPSGREIDVEAVYGRPFLGGQITANAFVRRQPGNIAALAPDVGAALRFSLGF